MAGLSAGGAAQALIRSNQLGRLGRLRAFLIGASVGTVLVQGGVLMMLAAGIPHIELDALAIRLNREIHHPLQVRRVSKAWFDILSGLNTFYETRVDVRRQLLDGNLSPHSAMDVLS